ncbi:hypothetical protein ACFTAO_06550 [Paenibacillus rhizoplanae]
MTVVFYNTGDRGETYKDVVTSAIAVTRPNTTVRLSSNAHYFSPGVNRESAEAGGQREYSGR